MWLQYYYSKSMTGKTSCHKIVPVVFWMDSTQNFTIETKGTMRVHETHDIVRSLFSWTSTVLACCIISGCVPTVQRTIVVADGYRRQSTIEMKQSATKKLGETYKTTFGTYVSFICSLSVLAFFSISLVSSPKRLLTFYKSFVLTTR